MLLEKVSEALKAGRFGSAFSAFPTIDDRDKWEQVHPEVKAYYLGMHRLLTESEPSPLPASLYAQFALNGDRTRFQKNYFERRNTLVGLVAAECLTDKGTYLDKIVDYIWAICEETTWIIPAHIHNTGTGRDMYLPDEEVCRSYIDLFSAETGSLLAWCLYLLGSRLDKITPVIRARVQKELTGRIFVPFRDHPEMGWRGYNKGQVLNNWTPWICSNVLMSALLACGDIPLRDEIIRGTAYSVDRFLNGYSEDGCCDEGPSYFDKAGASVLDTLEELYLASGGEVDLYDEPLIRAMSSYIMYVWVGGTKFVNFADCAPDVRPETMVLSRAAEKMGIPALSSFADYMSAKGYAAVPYTALYDGLFRRFSNILSYRGSREDAPAPGLPLSHAFPGTQVATVREKADGSGFFLAMKGGHNRESHNHNDIGSYCIWLDGEPLVCDAGVGTYRKETFSDKRYTIWTMQSGFHNTAILNGCDQQPGREFRAEGFAFTDDGNTASCGTDIAGAYGKEAGIVSYKRLVTADRAQKTVTVKDAWTYETGGETVLPVLCAVKPVETEDGFLLKGGTASLRIIFDKTTLAAETEPVPLTDESLQMKWQRKTLYRLLLKAEKGKQGEAVIVMKEE